MDIMDALRRASQTNKDEQAPDFAKLLATRLGYSYKWTLGMSTTFFLHLDVPQTEQDAFEAKVDEIFSEASAKVRALAKESFGDRVIIGDQLEALVDASLAGAATNLGITVPTKEEMEASQEAAARKHLDARMKELFGDDD